MEKFHPGYFLPTVAGGLVAAVEAGAVDQPRLGEVMFGLGMVCWFAVGSVILTRMFFRPLLPGPLLPTVAIEVAPPAPPVARRLCRGRELSGDSADGGLPWS